MRFEDQVAVITGAGSGIGRATTGILSSEGAHVIAVDVNRDALNRLIEEGAFNANNITPFIADVLDPSQVQNMTNEVVKAHGKIDFLVNAVGGSTIIPNYMATVDEMDLDDWDRVMAFNIRGTFLCTMTIVKQMKKQRRGKIVNISSETAWGLTHETTCAYAAAKAGIEIFTKKVAREVGSFGMTCNAIAPGLTLSERILGGDWGKMSDEEKSKFSSTIPLGRPALPEDQARVIAFLLSEDADYVTGVTIDVNGGLF